MSAGAIVGALVVAMFAANAALAFRLKEILRRAAKVDEMHVRPRGAIWRYQVSSIVLLFVMAIVYIVALVHSD